MSVSAAAIAKVATTLAQDKNVQKGIVTIIGIVIGIIILVIGCFFTICSSLSIGNMDIVSRVFGAEDSTVNIDTQNKLNSETITSINNMKQSLEKIDTTVEKANSYLGDSKLDSTWVKSVFFIIYFDKVQPEDNFYTNFVDCFITKQTVNNVEVEVPEANNSLLLENINSNFALGISEGVISEAKDCYSSIKNDSVST